MWPASVDQRLQQWVELRNRCEQLPISEALSTIGQWWSHTPWVPYYLHWDDQAVWPDPWQLLAENVYCDLARGLGIMYTLMFMTRPEFHDARLQEYHHENIVLVCGEKYILNSLQATLLNNNTKIRKPRHCVTALLLKQLYH